MRIKYAVVGTGALGGFYGGMLAKAGKDVHFLFRNDYNHVLKNGLKVDSVSGDYHLPIINAYNDTSKMPKCDVVLVCMKTTSNAKLKELLPPLLHKNSCVILVQNGLGMEELLQKDFPELNIGGALGFICASKINPGHIAHMDYGKLTIGSYKGIELSLLKQISEDLNESGVETVLTDDLILSRWKKLVWNVPYNGLSVALNTTTDKLMSNPSTYELIYAIMLEVISAANACGYNIKEGFAQAMLESTKIMKPYAPSMKLDFDNKRPLEIQSIYTNPLKIALENGFLMSKVEMLEKQLKFIQSNLLNKN
jgi:2-dehydropantoate 2-reductase